MAVTGNYIVNEPVLESHGCVLTGVDMEKELRGVVKRAISLYDYENGDKEELETAIRRALKNYFYKTTKQAPLIVVSILEL